MALKNYRQQTNSGLGSLTNCPSCNQTTSYSANACSGGATYNVNRIQGFTGSQQTLLPIYDIGDVVLVKIGASAPTFCATITGIVTATPTYFIDTVSGPWTQCSSCIVP